MKIEACVYVDEQPGGYRYPLELVVAPLLAFDWVRICIPDPEILEHASAVQREHGAGKISIHDQVPIRIRKPSDIADAQNACLEFLFDREQPPDFVVLVQADILLSADGVDRIKKYCELPGALAAPGNIWYIDLVRCHLRICSTPYGVTVFGVESKSRFDSAAGDGAYPTPYQGPYQERTVGVDVGYFAFDTYCRHMEQNAKTWHQPWSAPENLAAAVRRIRAAEPAAILMPRTREVDRTLAAFEAQEEYEEVKRLLKGD